MFDSQKKQSRSILRREIRPNLQHLKQILYVGSSFQSLQQHSWTRVKPKLNSHDAIDRLTSHNCQKRLNRWMGGTSGVAWVACARGERGIASLTSGHNVLTSTNVTSSHCNNRFREITCNSSVKNFIICISKPTCFSFLHFKFFPLREIVLQGQPPIDPTLRHGMEQRCSNTGYILLSHAVKSLTNGNGAGSEEGERDGDDVDC